jgi:hypothetical protein
LEELECIAERISHGAPADPRKYDEFASNGIPRMAGVPGFAAAGVPDFTVDMATPPQADRFPIALTDEPYHI